MTTGQPFPVLVGHLTLVDLLLLLAVVVVVPLGLRLVPLTGLHATRVLHVARLAHPVGAATAIIAFLLPTSSPAGIVAAGWLIVCGIAGLAGLTELVETRSVHPSHLVPAAALGFLTVGAAWLVASRAGIRLGFDPPIVELTAVHFHYAGFAATLMSALALLALHDASQQRRWVAAGAGVLVVVGTPLTATGIATGISVLVVLGPILLATGVLTTAALTAFVIAPLVPAGSARWLLRISAVGVVVPMLLGVDYAVARVTGAPALDLRTMALIHGDLNALVFALLGFLGWTRALALRPAGVP